MWLLLAQQQGRARATRSVSDGQGRAAGGVKPGMVILEDSVDARALSLPYVHVLRSKLCLGLGQLVWIGDVWGDCKLVWPSEALGLRALFYLVVEL